MVAACASAEEVVEGRTLVLSVDDAELEEDVVVVVVDEDDVDVVVIDEDDCVVDDIVDDAVDEVGCEVCEVDAVVLELSSVEVAATVGSAENGTSD